MGKALYRKYRPVRLDDVVGQKQVTDTLFAALKQGKLSHAYLFVGPRGTGKTSVARIFAHKINNFDYKLEDNPIDIIEIDGASNRRIEDIRELREKITIAPTVGKYKVYIIDEVHMLTKEAFNALLKTLEEPPQHAIFVMATTDVYKVPVTITSRSQIYTFKLADFKTMFNFLKTVAEKEQIKIDDDALEIVTERGGGSFRDSLSLLDQVSALSEDTITGKMLTAALGVPEDAVIARLLEAYVQKKNETIVAELKNLLESGLKPETLAEEMVRFIVSNPRSEWMGLLAKLTEVRAPFVEAKILVALCRGDEGAGNPQPRMQATNAASLGQTTERIMAPKAAETKVVTTTETKDTSGNDDATKNHTAPEIPSEVIENGTYSGEFSWDNFLQAVKERDNGTYANLKKCHYNFSNGVLHIYPDSGYLQKIFEKKERKEAMIAAAPGVKITIHDHASSPVNAKKDDTLAKISDIMGGEVKNDGGNNPFN